MLDSHQRYLHHLHHVLVKRQLFHRLSLSLCNRHDVSCTHGMHSKWLPGQSNYPQKPGCKRASESDCKDGDHQKTPPENCTSLWQTPPVLICLNKLKKKLIIIFRWLTCMAVLHHGSHFELRQPSCDGHSLPNPWHLTLFN